MAGADNCRVSDSIVNQVETFTTVSGLVGIGGSSLLLLICLCKGQYRSDLVLGRLVLLLALSDLLANLWLFGPNWIQNRRLSLNPCVPWCGWWLGGVRFLQAWSVVLSAGIALAVLFALLKKPDSVQRFRHFPAVSIPIAFVLNLNYVFYPAYLPSDEGQFRPDAYCVSPDASQDTFEGLLIVIFFAVWAVHCFGIIEMRKHSPGSVVRRAYKCASRYLVAFLLSYGPYVVTRLLLEAQILRTNSCGFWWAQHVRDMCYIAAGFFNLIAYQAVRIQEIAQSVVTFGGSEEHTFFTRRARPRRRRPSQHEQHASETDGPLREWGFLLMEAPLGEAGGELSSRPRRPSEPGQVGLTSSPSWLEAATAAQTTRAAATWSPS